MASQSESKQRGGNGVSAPPLFAFVPVVNDPGSKIRRTIVAIVAAGDVWLVEFWTRCSNQYALNVKAYVASNPVGAVGVTDQALADHFALNVLPFYRSVMPSVAETYGVQVRRTHPSTAAGAFTVNVTTGLLGSTVSPLQVAGLIRFRNSGLGRKNKSRMYVPFVPLTSVGPVGIPTSLYVIRVGNLAIDIMGPHTVTDVVDTIDMSLVTNSSPASTYRPLTDYSVAPQFATMRSRSKLYGPDSAPF